MSYLGHRGQHGLARSLGEKTGQYWTPADAGRALSAMGAAWSDPVPANGAYERGRWLLSLFGWK